MLKPDQERPPVSRHALTWPAVALLLLSPAVGEMLSGSEPPSSYFQPVTLVLLTLLYGVGAVICRELTHRWGKGWPTLLLLGAAYGVAEEGLVIGSFFNFNHADLGPMRGWDRWLGVNWVWSLDLTVYHAVFSIAVCVLLVSHMFLGRRDEPWVGRRTFAVLCALFVANGLLILAFFCHMTGFRPPPVHYAFAALLMAGLVATARRVPHPLRVDRRRTGTAPHPFWFGLVGFGGAVGFYAHLLACAPLGLHAVAAFLVMIFLVLLVAEVALWMARRGGVGPRHELALGCSALLVMAIVALLQEADNARPDNTAGMGLAALGAVLLIAWLTWRTRRRALRGAATALLCIAALAVAMPARAGRRGPHVLPSLRSMTTVLEGRAKSVDWCVANGLIALGRWRPDGYVDVFVMRPDGTDLRCLTGRPGLCPQRHNGNPAWHPSGDYVVFTAQNPDAARGEGGFEGRLRSKSVPGTGLNCNLWLVTADGSRAWQLTHVPTDYEAPRGVIHPQFSHDGRRLFWAGAVGEYPRHMPWGRWSLYVADFVVEDEAPRLENVVALTPGRQQHFYESHAFSGDDRRLLFCANAEPGQEVTGLDVYEYDPAADRLTNLTRTRRDWDEHAHYSPDGRWIAWMSSADLDVRYRSVRGHDWQGDLKTELWIMDAAGQERRRLTHFNEEGHPHYLGGRNIVSDSAWSPDGRSLIVLVANEPEEGARLKASLVRVELDLPGR
jgi:Tol biopolymer transport system component